MLPPHIITALQNWALFKKRKEKKRKEKKRKEKKRKEKKRKEKLRRQQNTQTLKHSLHQLRKMRHIGPKCSESPPPKEKEN